MTFRTYYFGVRFVSLSVYSGDYLDDECEEEVDKLSGLALRNMNQDVEKIVQQIQGYKDNFEVSCFNFHSVCRKMFLMSLYILGFLRWTGHMDDFITRDTVLQV